MTEAGQSAATAKETPREMLDVITIGRSSVDLTRSAATWHQPPGAAPRSMTRLPGASRWCRSSISMSLKAARDR